MIRLHDVTDPPRLLHHLLVDVEPPGRVDDHDVGAGALGLLHGVLRDLDGIAALARDRDADLLTERAELRDGGGPLEVRGDEQRSAPLLLEPERELGAGRGLPGALDARHHHDGRPSRREDELLVRPSERLLELVPDDLDHLLGRREALHHLFGQRPCAHAGEEVVDDLHRDVGLQERGPDVGQRVVDLLGVQLPARAELLERAVELGGQGVEHRAEPYSSGVVSPGPMTSSTAWSRAIGLNGLVK